MKRILLAALVLAGCESALASANLDCSAQDKNVAKLEIEAITSRDGSSIASLRGELEISAGKRIEFSAQDLKSHYGQKNIALTFAKRTPEGMLEIRIYAKPVGDGDLDFEGTYVVRLGKINRSGKIACQAG